MSTTPPEAPDREAPFVSVVIIARNEEATIANAVAAALAALGFALRNRAIRAGEVILVDSASTDRTVERSVGFPLTILQIPPEWPRSPGAGRQVGWRRSQGDVVFFVDGDTYVREDWLPAALRVLDGPGVGAVGGAPHNVSPGRSWLAREILRIERGARPREGVEDADAVNVGVYRRSALERVGGFHPFLRGSEDLDLGARLRAAGLRLLRTPEIVGSHVWSPREEDIGFVTYLRSVAWWSYGGGQACRYRFRDRGVRAEFLGRYLSARHVIEYGKALALAAAALLHVLVAASYPIALLALAPLDAMAGFAVWRRSKRAPGVAFRTLHGLTYPLVRHGGFAMGFLAGTEDPERYPKGERVLREGPVLRA